MKHIISQTVKESGFKFSLCKLLWLTDILAHDILVSFCEFLWLTLPSFLKLNYWMYSSNMFCLQTNWTLLWDFKEVAMLICETKFEKFLVVWGIEAKVQRNVKYWVFVNVFTWGINHNYSLLWRKRENHRIKQFNITTFFRNYCGYVNICG